MLVLFVLFHFHQPTKWSSCPMMVTWIALIFHTCVVVNFSYIWKNIIRSWNKNSMMQIDSWILSCCQHTVLCCRFWSFIGFIATIPCNRSVVYTYMLNSILWRLSCRTSHANQIYYDKQKMYNYFDKITTCDNFDN